MKSRRLFLLLMLILLLAGCGGPESSLQRGNIAYRQGQMARAAGFYTEALKSPQTRASAAFNLGRISFEEKRYETALEYFDTALSMEVEYPLVRVYRARTLKALGDLEAAEADLRRVVDSKLEEPSASLELARLLADKKECSEALKVLGPALAAPGFAEEASLLEARCYHELGDVRRAIAVLERLLATHSYRVPTHFTLAAYLMEVNDFSGAERRYRAGLQMAPSHAPALLGLAAALAAQGKVEEARRYYTMVKESGAPTHPLVQEAERGLSQLGATPPESGIEP